MNYINHLMLYMPFYDPNSRELLAGHRSLHAQTERELHLQPHPLRLLNQLLSLAKRDVLPNSCPEKRLFDWMGYDIIEGVPAAEVTAEMDGLSAHAYWLRADPVYWRPDTQGIYMQPLTGNELSLHQARQFEETINELLTGQDLTFYTPSPSRWYLGSSEPFYIHTYTLTEASLHDITDYQPYGLEAETWRRWLTEVQIMMEQHPLNEIRIENQQKPVNSLWLWGEGQIDPPVSNESITVYSNDILAHGLAERAGCDYQPLPETFDDIQGDYQTLILTLEADEMAMADTLNQQWLQPIIQALKTRRVRYLTLYPGDDECYRFRNSWLKRRRLPLNQ